MIINKREKEKIERGAKTKVEEWDVYWGISKTIKWINVIGWVDFLLQRFWITQIYIKQYITEE